MTWKLDNGGGGREDRKLPNRSGPVYGSGASGAPGYGRPIAVVYGSAVVEGQLVYAGKVSHEFAYDLKLDDFGAVSTSDPGLWTELQVAPVEYVFAQGVIDSWHWFSRDGLNFIPGGTWPATVTPEWAAGHGIRGTYVAHPPELTLGNAGTATEWATVAGGTAAQRVRLGHFVALRSGQLVCPDGKYPTLRAMLRGRLATATIDSLPSTTQFYGAAPGAVIREIVEDGTVGLGLGTSLVETAVGTDGLAASSLDRYAAQRNFYVARAFVESAPAAAAIEEVLDAADASAYWTGTALRLIPMGESVVGTYSPAATATPFTDDDFVLEDAGSDADAIEVRRSPESDVATVVPIEFTPAYAGDGSTTTIEAMDAARSQTIGVRRADAVSIPCVPTAKHARTLSQIRAQRSIHNRSTFSWRASWRFLFVEPGDLVQLTHAAMGLDRLVRVTAVEEAEDGLRFEGVEWFSGVSVAIDTLPPTSDGLQNNPLVPPNASAANSTLLDMADDGIISRSEKASVLNLLAQMVADCETYTASLWQPSGAATPWLDWSYAWSDYTGYWRLYCDVDPYGFDIAWLRPGTRNETKIAAWLASDTVLITTSAQFGGSFTRPAYVVTPPQLYRWLLSNYFEKRAAFFTYMDNFRSSAKGVMTSLAAPTVTAITGTPSSATFLRGDGRWDTPAGGGTVTGVTGTDPVMSSGGTAPAISIRKSASGARWNNVPVVGSDGVMEIGQYLDFHESNADTSDFSARLTSLGGSLIASGVLYANGIVHAQGSRPVTMDPASGTIQCKGDAGGWATGLNFKGSAATDLGYFGAYGSADALGYFFVGSFANPRATFDAGGTFTSVGNVVAYSDARLKRDVRPVFDALGLVGRMRGVTFERIDQPDAGRQVGVIAQEIRQVCPEVVHEAANGTLGVAYGNLVGVLIEAIKELTARVRKLEGGVNGAP
jgi:hypothetical protein